jgi:hypothetical protein
MCCASAARPQQQQAKAVDQCLIGSCCSGPFRDFLYLWADRGWGPFQKATVTALR